MLSWANMRKGGKGRGCQICIVGDRGAAGSFQRGDSLDKQFIWLLAISHYVRYTTAAVVFIESLSMFARVVHHRRYEITHNIVKHWRL